MAGTVFHRTRTDLAKWFLATYLMGRDKRGVSAKFLQRELGVAYQTAWTMAQKLRHRRPGTSQGRAGSGVAAPKCRWSASPVFYTISRRVGDSCIHRFNALYFCYIFLLKSLDRIKTRRKNP